MNDDFDDDDGLPGVLIASSKCVLGFLVVLHGAVLVGRVMFIT